MSDPAVISSVTQPVAGLLFPNSEKVDAAMSDADIDTCVAEESKQSNIDLINSAEAAGISVWDLPKYFPPPVTKTSPDASQVNLDYSGVSIEAVVRAQRIVRGFLGRLKAKRQLLLTTWKALDTKEEQELADTHQNYEELRDLMTNENAMLRALSGKSQILLDNEREAIRAPSHEFVAQVQTRMRQLRVLQEFREHAVPHPGHEAPLDLRVDLSLTEEEEPFEAVVRMPKALPADLTVPSHVLAQYPRSCIRPITAARPIDLEWVTDLRDELASGLTLRARQVERLIALAYELLVKEPNVRECSVPRHGKVTIVGDVHGQLPDLLSIFRLNGTPSATNVYLFNGDWVDRGQASCECLLLILAWKVLLPEHVFLNRGNHEAEDINSRDGFERECLQKYGPGLFPLFSELFAAVPLATVVRGTDLASGQPLPSIFVVHGGVPARNVTLAELQAIDRFHRIPPPNSLMANLLWSDPTSARGLFPSSRGAGCEFGPDITYQFLRANNFCMLIRSHECVEGGWALAHHNMCATVFSASNYCGIVGNQGAFAIIEANLRPTFVTYFARKEVLATRASIRYRNLENDVIKKLMDRIAVHRIDLIKEFSHYAKDNQERAQRGEQLDLQTTAAMPCSADIISRSQWAEGLRKVLKLNIPFLLFQEQLGLPARGVLGDERGPINFLDFLFMFRPKPLRTASGPLATGALQLSEAVETLTELLMAHRYELESVFRFLDFDNDQRVTRDEFVVGVMSLVRLFQNRAQRQLEEGGKLGFSEATRQRLMDTRWEHTHVEELADYVDVNGDGVIQYTEFAEKFGYDALRRCPSPSPYDS